MNGSLKLNEINAFKALIKSEIKLERILIYKRLEEKHEQRILGLSPNKEQIKSQGILKGEVSLYR
jgi:hypothetical protein